MLSQDRAVTSKDDKWELYEKLNGGPGAEKDVVIANKSGGFSISIQREEFRKMVNRYFEIKGY
jgi:hypothetical protein